MIDDLDQFRLGETDATLALETSEDCRQVALALAQQAQRSIRIWSYDLDPRLLDSTDFAQAVRDIAIGHKNNQIRILVLDPDRVVKHGHRLVELARRLPSSIEIRKIMEDYGQYVHAFLVADDRGFMHRQLADRFEGSANFYSPLRARELSRLFDEVWEKSQQFREFRRLHL